MSDFTPDRRRTWLRWAGTLLSLSLLAWMLARQDWQAFLSYAGTIPAASLGGALAFALAAQAGNSMRWWSLLRAQNVRVGYRDAFKLTVTGNFASNFLPGTIGGDVLRIAGILPRSPGRAVGIASVVLDRALGVFTMLLVLPLSLTTFWPTLNATWPSVFPLFLGRIPRRLESAWRRLLDLAQPWLRQPRSLIGAFLASGVGVVCYWVALWILALGLRIRVDLWEVAGVTGITYFLSQIPISINALGVREAAMIALYGQLGAAPEQAAALALVSRLIAMLATVPGSVWLPGLLPAARAVRVQETDG